MYLFGTIGLPRLTSMTGGAESGTGGRGDRKDCLRGSGSALGEDIDRECANVWVGRSVGSTILGPVVSVPLIGSISVSVSSPLHVWLVA